MIKKYGKEGKQQQIFKNKITSVLLKVCRKTWQCNEHKKAYLVYSYLSKTLIYELIESGIKLSYIIPIVPSNELIFYNGNTLNQKSDFSAPLKEINEVNPLSNNLIILHSRNPLNELGIA